MNKAETARSLGLPKDVVFGMPVINIKGCVGIKGKCLEIEYLDDDQIQIKGIICIVEYENHNRQK